MADKDKETKGDKGKKADLRRRRVAKACVYCHRSHLMCDAERPCSRCRKRNIAHLCRDEEDDLHVLFGKLRSEIGQFHQGLCLQREKDGITIPPSSMSLANGSDSNKSPASSHGNFATGSADSTASSGGNSTQAKLLSDSCGSKGRPELIAEWVCGGLGTHPSDAAHSPVSVEERFSGPDSTSLLAFSERLQCQTAEVESEQFSQVLSGPQLLKYSNAQPKLLEYSQSRIPASQLRDIIGVWGPLRREFLDKLLAMEYKDLMNVSQSFERLLLSARKYMTTLMLPGMVVRQSGYIATVSDHLAHILGYSREELLGQRYLHELIPDSQLHGFYTGPAAQCQGGGCQTCVCTISLIRKSGKPLATRASLSLQRCPTSRAVLGTIVIFFPLEAPFPHMPQTESEVIRSNFINTEPVEHVRHSLPGPAQYPLLSMDELQAMDL